MLKVLESNPRYFTDSSGKAIYMAGSHTWNNFKDFGDTNPPEPFDFNSYLDFLHKFNHNFFRLWALELPRSAQGLLLDKIWFRSPFPWPRTGPATATDGGLRFDLSRFDQTYFDRMYSRVATARDRGFYVAVMIFDGFCPQFNRNPEDGFPYDANNNINGISCGGIESQTLVNQAVTEVQEAYVKKVIDTMNDFDNIVYEIANESGDYSTAWQYHMINFIKEYEMTKPKQHLVGMTVQYKGGINSTLFESSAEWISPNNAQGYGDPDIDPPASDGEKIIVNDTDHSFYFISLLKADLEGQRSWVWKNFARGNHVLFMDPYLLPWPGRNVPDGSNPDPYWDTLRLNMGYTRIYAEKMNLAEMKPHNALSSTGYCLANPASQGAEYFVYLPSNGTATVDLSAALGKLNVEWFDPCTGKTTYTDAVTGGVAVSFTAPFEGDAILYIKGNKL
jgi:hypothetical protein